MSRRLAITIDADDSRLTNVRGSIVIYFFAGGCPAALLKFSGGSGDDYAT